MSYTAYMAQIFLFTGENEYELSQQRQRWVSSFIEKHGEENYSLLTSKNASLTHVLNEVCIAPFIADNRLVLVEGIPSLTKEEIIQISTQMHEQSILVFVEAKPDKRLSATKELLKIAEVKEFNPLTGRSLEQWAESMIQQSNGSIQQDALQLLVQMSGGNQQFLSQEIEKVLLYAQGSSITKDHIDTICMTTGEQQVWHLMDLLGSGKVNEAIEYAHSLIDRGEDAYGLWARMLWMVSNLVKVAAAVQEGETSIATLAKKTGVPFPSVKGLLPIAKKIDPERLSRILLSTIDTDVQLKSGGYKATNDEPQELEAIIDRTILMFQI